MRKLTAFGLLPLLLLVLLLGTTTSATVKEQTVSHKGGNGGKVVREEAKKGSQATKPTITTPHDGKDSQSRRVRRRGIGRLMMESAEK